MQDVTIFQAVLPGDPTPVYVFAYDFGHAVELLLQSRQYQIAGDDSPIVLANVVARLRQGGPDVTQRAWEELHDGFIGLASYDSESGWVPQTACSSDDS